MSSLVDIFLADPFVASFELPPFHPNSVAYVYRLWFDSGKSDAELLGAAFRMLNIEHPPDYRQLSLSVGDVVTIDCCRSYRCAAMGWESLPHPLLPRHGWREAVYWFRVKRRQVKPIVGRALCRLRGCTASELEACVRCHAFVYAPHFLMEPRWISRIFNALRSLRHKAVHRCQVCRRCIWFSEASCCSEACFEEWFPF
jgi:hypothetical protein